MKKKMSAKQGKMHPKKHPLDALFAKANGMQPKVNNYPSPANALKNAFPMKKDPPSKWAESLKMKPASCLKTC